MISIAGLEKHKVFKALYDNAKPLGMGILHFVPGNMTEEEAKQTIDSWHDKSLYFDYHKGRLMKVVIGGDEFNPCSYDRDNGDGAAARAIDSIR